jgi:UDP-N-acetylmuramoyl-L-alanyl-D-glutamate--2,6-diaminopimelate ligase
MPLARILSSLKRLVPQRHPLRLWWHWLRAFLAALSYGFPARRLTVIGITGTDGKTTTVGMLTHILHSCGRTGKVGAVSTACFQRGENCVWNETQKTSVSPFVLQRFLRRLVQAGCTHAVLEVSSHGLVQGRVHYTFPRVAAITNTSREHLDYHGSMDQYRADKGKLFRMLRGPFDRFFGRAGKGTKILNAADESFAKYQEIPSAQTITYGREGADLWISAIEEDAKRCRALLHLSISRPTGQSSGQALRVGTAVGVVVPLVLPLPGSFNLENALCALGCAQALGIPLHDGLRALAKYPGTPGRLERIEEDQDFLVFVDFTVTPVAYERTLRTLRCIVGEGGRVLVLCGSCGERMREKRPVIGRIVSELADVVVVSNEDPYSEDPLKIIEEVWSGVQRDRVEAHKIPDRREAIRFLFSQARKGDAVILCAKGADTTMWVATGQIPWNERTIARELLRELSSERKQTLRRALATALPST